MTTKKKASKSKYWHDDPGKFSVWLCLPMGMYAISHRWPKSYDPTTDPRDIQVRARKRKYLDRLRHSYLPELGKDEGRAGEGTDYGHRAFVSSTDLARAFARMALDIDATGFKSHTWDNDLHGVYSSIWSDYVRLDDNSPYNKPWGSSYYGKQHYTWTKPPEGHTARPQDCLRYGYHWWDAKDGNATCVDCGAVRTWVRKTTKGTDSYRYEYPPGAVVLCTKDGRTIARDKQRRMPGGPAIVEDAKAPAGTTLHHPTRSTGTGWAPSYGKTTTYGLGTPTKSGAPWADTETTGRNADCLDYGEHWWATEGSAKCRDCGAIRVLDPDTGEWRIYQPEGSVMLTDELGYDIDDPHVVTEDEVTEPPVDLGDVPDACSECGGTGYDIHDAVCEHCDGSGEEPTEVYPEAS